MTNYYVDFAGGSEICVQADSEREAIEKAQRQFIGQSIVKVWHA